MVKNKIEKQVLDRITPDKEYKERVNKTINEIKKEIKKEITERDLPVKIELVGSTAKDTYLKDSLDIDFFILFPTKFPKEKIGKKAISIGKKILKDTEESYAEHPYLRGYYKNFKIEIVPCYKIEKASQKLSAVDRTPLHTKYVKKHLREKQKQEVRLFKQFLKGIGCYGAEAEVEGFSGYLCEILVLYYKSFNNIVKNAEKWKQGIKLMLCNYKHPDFDTPLIFIDPVDSNRNVASALSKDKFGLFIKACKEYLKKPSVTFFFPKPIKQWSIEKISSEIKKQNCRYIAIKIAKPKIITENLYPQLRKAVRSIWKASEINDFNVYDAVFHVEKNIILIIIKTEIKPLSKTIIHTGPPTKLKKHVKEFINKWKEDPRVTKKPYEKNNRLYVEIEREHTKIKDFLKHEIKKLSLGKHIDEIVKNNYEIIDLKDFLNDEQRVFWTGYLDKKMPWRRK